MFDGREKIGGPGKFVQIDENKIGNKYHCGHVVEGQWSCCWGSEKRTLFTLFSGVKMEIYPERVFKRH